MAMASSKPRSRIDLPQAVMDKALKRETGTRPTHSAGTGQQKRPPTVGKEDLAATKRLRGNSTLH